MDISDPAGQVAAAAPIGADHHSPAAAMGGWAVLLCLMVASFAVLLASFPARNSDLAVHLASGRATVQGDLALSQFPVAIAPSNWLYDVLCYAVVSTLGGAMLVALKALTVAATALVLMRLSRLSCWWLPATLTALGLLAMSTRFQLQPAIFAYLLFAIVIALLRRRDVASQTESLALLSYWPLVLTMLIWPHLSGGWIVGLVVIACFGIGRRCGDRARSGVGAESMTRDLAVWAMLAGVCLLNPRFWATAAWLPELRWLGIPVGLPEGEHITSPFTSEYWSVFGRVPAGLAYYPLLGLSLLSFLLNVKRWHWRWFLPWLALAGASALQVRAVPLFAVLAAPVAAWNLQEYFAAHAEDPERWSVRALVAALGTAFVVCAWPGWLQQRHYEPPRWAIEWSPSLVRSAQAYRHFHDVGKLTSATKGLHLSRDAAGVFAWLCPQQSGVWDEELSAPFLGQARQPDDFLERLRGAGIHHLIVHHTDPGRLFAALHGLGADPAQWPLLHLEGDVAIVGWRDPGRIGQPDPFAGWELDLQQLALRPPATKQAPPERPERDADARRWWQAFWQPASPRSFEYEEAEVYLLRAESFRSAAPFRHMVDWEAIQVAGLSAAGSGWTAWTSLSDAPLRLHAYRPNLTFPAEPAATPTLGHWVLVARQNFRFQRDDCPPESLFLAIRAARRALQHNPQDANAYHLLGDCYLRLRRDTRERVWGQRLEELAQLRQAQASEALNQAVSLNPNLQQAHFNLSALYFDLKYLDLALQHRQASAAASDGSAPPGDQLGNELKMLAKTVHDLEQWHAENAAGLLVLDRARLAAHKGLAAKARQLLVESDVSAFGADGMKLELELLLRTGRAKAVREWTEPEHAGALGEGNLRWLRAQAFAASGDYALADREATLASGGRDEGAVTPRDLITLIVGQHAALEAGAWSRSLPELIRRVLTRAVLQDRVGALEQMMRREADVSVLQGVLALEQGDTDKATAAFRRALSIWNPTGAGGAVDFDARGIAQAWLEKLR